MNVIVTNRQENMLNGLNVEVIKTLRGEFEVEQIIATFSNFLFARMILDITAIKNFTDMTNFQKLTIGIPVDKIILLLPNDPAYANQAFLSKLISIGYYNFTTNLEGVKYLLNKPNTYKEVAHLHQVNVSNQNVRTENGIPLGKIIGFKNVTEHAGATTLVYVLKKQLEKHYNMDALAIEVNKKDFLYYNDSSLVSLEKNELPSELIKARNKHVVLIDLNDCDPNVCDEVYYLIEPSIIKFNKLMKNNINILENLRDKKIILNKTLLPQHDIIQFAKETRLNIFSVISPIDDRREDLFLDGFLAMLGYK